MFESPDNPQRYPVLTYLAQKEQRPAEMMDAESPFYLAINTNIPKVKKMPVQGFSTWCGYLEIYG